MFQRSSYSCMTPTIEYGTGENPTSFSYAICRGNGHFGQPLGADHPGGRGGGRRRPSDSRHDRAQRRLEIAPGRSHDRPARYRGSAKGFPGMRCHQARAGWSNPTHVPAEPRHLLGSVPTPLAPRVGTSGRGSRRAFREGRITTSKRNCSGQVTATTPFTDGGVRDPRPCSHPDPGPSRRRAPRGQEGRGARRS